MTKSKHRGNGEGSIFKFKDGWRACLTVGLKPDGTPIRKTRNAPTRAEAAKKLDELKSVYGFRVSKPTSNPRISEYLEDWLHSVQSTARPGTVELYRNSVNNHIGPHLGSMKIRDLAPINIERWVQKLDGLGPRARQNAFAIFKRALKAAVRLQVIHANPMEGFTAPKHNRKEIVPFEPVDAKAIVDSFQGTYWDLFVRLGFQTGLRQGELLGLQWQDVDGVTLQVRRQMTERSGVSDLKTAASLRQIPLSEELSDLISDQRKDALRRGAAAKDSWVFIGPRGGVMKRANFLQRWWKPKLEELGIDYRGPHHMRHTFATMMLNGGCPITVVSRLLGHSKVSTTLDVYSHVLTQDIEAARSMIGKLLA